VANSRKLLVLLLAFSAAACAADSSLLNLLMPNADVLVGVNVERIMESAIGKEIGAQVQGAAPQVQQILKQTGFDPAHDLKEILIATTGKGKEPPVLILVRGSFDAAKVSSFFAGSGAQTENYEGVQILNNPKQGHSAAAFLDNTLAVGGDLDQVRAAIHRRTRQTALAPEQLSQIAALSDRYDVWVNAAVPMARTASGDSKPNFASNPNFKQVADLLQSIERVSGGVKLSSSIDLALVILTRSEKDAGRIQDALGFLSMFVVANKQNPSGLKPGAFNVSADARTVRVSITVTEAELKKAYQLQMARNAEKPPALQRPRPVPDDGGLMIQSSDKDMGTVALAPAQKD
jgi:hypothetical protein